MVGSMTFTCSCSWMILWYCYKQKLVALKQCADKLGMIIHPTKTKYISVNCDEAAPVDVDDISVEKTDQYVYLGSPIFSGSIADQVQAHINMEAPQTLKFLSFLTKNSDAPFQVKEKVWNSAMLSAVQCCIFSSQLRYPCLKFRARTPCVFITIVKLV